MDETSKQQVAWHGIIDPKDGSEVDAAVAIKL